MKSSYLRKLEVRELSHQPLHTTYVPPHLSFFFTHEKLDHDLPSSNITSSTQTQLSVSLSNCSNNIHRSSYHVRPCFQAPEDLTL